MLFVAGFLLLLTGIIAGIDYLNKHGRMLFNRLRTFIRKKALAKFWDHFSGKEDMGDPPGVHPAF
jgi:site-specific recombinase